MLASKQKLPKTPQAILLRVCLHVAFFIGVLTGQAHGQMVAVDGSDSRTWTDPSGYYQVSGVLTHTDGKKCRLKLVDESIIEITANDLHENDQKYIELTLKGQKEDGAASGASRPSGPRKKKFTKVPFFVNQASFGSDSWSYSQRVPRKFSALSESELLVEKSVNQQGEDEIDGLKFKRAVVSDDGQFATVAFSAKRGRDPVTIVKRVSTKTKRVVAEQVVPDNVMAISPSGTRIATSRPGKGFENGLIVVRNLAEPEKVIRQYPTASFFSEGFAAKTGVFLDDSILVLLGKRMVIIDLDHGKGISTAPLESIDAYAVNQDRNLIAVVSGANIHIFDLLAGKSIGTFKWEQSSTLGSRARLCFSPDNKKFACFNYETVVIADLKTGQTIDSFPYANNSGGKFSWPAEDFLMIHNQLIGLGLKIPVWDYTIGYGQSSKQRSGSEYVNFNFDDNGVRIQPFTVPPNDLAAKLAGVKLKDLRPMPAGSKVKLEMTGLQFSRSEMAEIRTNVERRFEKMGVELADDGDFLLTMKIEREKRKTEKYKNEYNPFANDPNRRGDPLKKTADGSFSYTPFKASVILTTPDGKILYSRRDSRDMKKGGTIRTEENESVQQWVDRKMKLSPNFFKPSFPQEFIRFSNGRRVLGSTKLTQ